MFWARELGEPQPGSEPRNHETDHKHEWLLKAAEAKRKRFDDLKAHQYDSRSYGHERTELVVHPEEDGSQEISPGHKNQQHQCGNLVIAERGPGQPLLLHTN